MAMILCLLVACGGKDDLINSTDQINGEIQGKNSETEAVVTDSVVSEGLGNESVESESAVTESTLTTNPGLMFSFDDWTRTYDVISYTGNATSVEIPSVYEGYPVTNIGDAAFEGCSNLTSVTIGSGVTFIGEYAFKDCSSLTSLTIPDSVMSIGKGAFSGCSSLASILVAEGNETYHSQGNCLIETASKTLILGCNNSTIPNDGSVTSIGAKAFSGCKELKNVTIPDGVTSIGAAAFLDCRSLTNITIPNGVAVIDRATFSGCSSLMSLTIPDGVTRIGEDAFSGCAKLVEIINHSSLILTTGSSYNGYVAYYAKEIHNETSKIVNVEDYLFYSYDNIHYLLDYVGEETALVLPASYNDQNYEIYRRAFADYSGMTSVTIPDSVTSIGPEAFEGCDGLTSIAIGSGVTSIDDTAFGVCGNLMSITVAPGNETYHSQGNCLIETASKTLLLGCNNSQVPDDGSVTSIYHSAFFDCSELTSVTIPDGVTSIGSEAFGNCSGLECVTISNSVTDISILAFYGCNSLTTIYYKGTAGQWKGVDISWYGNEILRSVTVYYYSEAQMANGWRYVDGVPTPW